MTSINVVFPPAFQCLFQPARYKCFYGGRGGAKSWAFARALLLQGAQRPLRILCAREFQNSLTDSVYKLLKDQISLMGLESIYEVQQRNIIGHGPAEGTEFAFEGIKQNTQKIRSYEGIDICWIEEAVLVTKSSWDVLVPTIRKENSEIWLTFNPDLESDETYQRFIVNPPPEEIDGKRWSYCVKVSWRDNPWFPSALRAEMEQLKEKNLDDYLHVWEGHCKQVLEGAVYADEMRAAAQEGRITKVPYSREAPVHTFWDLGRSDMTAIWMAQIVGFEYRIVDFYQNRLKFLDHYIEELQKRPYVWGTDWLPHDAKAKQLGSKRTIEEQLREKRQNVRIVPRLSISDGINAARTIFPSCWFDQERCADGLQALRHYCYEVDERSKEFSRDPKHDWASHASDAFRYMGIALKQPTKRAERLAENLKKALGPSRLELEPLLSGGPTMLGWMK